MAALALGAAVVGAGVGAGAAAGAFDAGEDAALPPVFSPPPAGADEASPAPDGEDKTIIKPPKNVRFIQENGEIRIEGDE